MAEALACSLDVWVYLGGGTKEDLEEANHPQNQHPWWQGTRPRHMGPLYPQAPRPYSCRQPHYPGPPGAPL